MNREKLLSLIADSIVIKYITGDSTIELSSVTTNLQHSTQEDIVFYNVEKGNAKSEESFRSRIKEASPGLLILNEEASDLIKSNNAVFVKSADFLKLQKVVLDEIFPNKHTMKMVGVTGTNGKTTTVNLAMQIASMSGHPSLSIGTIGVQDMNGPLIADIESTTPSYVELRKLIYQFQDKYEVCFLEVSSHALVQNRLFDIALEAAAWTSFSQDHLDYHRTMEEYFKAKLLIEQKYLKEGASLLVPAHEVILFEKIKEEAPQTRLKIAKTLEQRSFHKNIKERPLFYYSSYNESNAEIALQLNEDLFGTECLKKILLKDIKTPLGRFSVIELDNESMAIVDYAHTPDALINIGNAIKSAFPHHFLTVIFGCGGNRDKSKRPLMGKAVSDFADKMIVTSDNPRDEAPEEIILDVLKGIKGSYEAVVDRRKAIEIALEEINEKEIILIAGKGHEEYQEIKGVKYPFSDFTEVMNFKAGI